MTLTAGTLRKSALVVDSENARRAHDLVTARKRQDGNGPKLASTTVGRRAIDRSAKAVVRKKNEWRWSKPRPRAKKPSRTREKKRNAKRAYREHDGGVSSTRATEQTRF